ncbi:MAG TPA: PEP-CTERM sorting domain-containing protein [Tepidisphaeraceae bacterium]|nr:PEP-CTERM sorting domain-containing protein [Tepidisphaeraceae bacterium]
MSRANKWTLSMTVAAAAAAIGGPAGALDLVNENYTTGSASGWTPSGTSSIGLYAPTSTELAASVGSPTGKVLTFGAAGDQGVFQTGTRAVAPSGGVAFTDKVFVMEWSTFATAAASSQEFYKTVVQLTDADGAGIQFANLFNTKNATTLDGGDPQANQLKGRTNTLTVQAGVDPANSAADVGTYKYNGLYGRTVKVTSAATTGSTNRSAEDTSGILGTIFNQEAVIRTNDVANFNLNVEWTTLNNVGGQNGTRDLTMGGIKKVTVTKDAGGAETGRTEAPLAGFTTATVTAARPGLAFASGFAAVTYADGSVYHGEADGTAVDANKNHQLGFGKFALREFHRADVDRSNVVDNGDFGTVFGNFDKTGATWADGDSDNSGVVDNGDFGDVFGAFNATLVANDQPMAAFDSPSKANLVYNPATGHLILDAGEAAGAVITNFVLKNAAGGTDFVTGANLPFDNFTKKSTGLEISNTDLTATGFSGTFDLGVVLPTDLTETDLTNLLTQRTYVGSLGSGTQTFDVVVAPVPEPGTFGLLGAAAIGLLARRRRQAW